MSGFGKKELLGKICHKITDGTHKTPAYQDSGIVFLSAKNIKNGTLSLADHKYISEEEHLELTKRCKPEAGDVMLSKSGSLGDAITVPNLPFSFSIFESLALIKPKRDILSAEYLQQYLNSPLSKRYFWSITSGIAVKHLHLVDLRKMPINLPSLAVQAQITGALGIWDNAIEKTEALIAAKEKQFEWLCQTYFKPGNSTNSGWEKHKIASFFTVRNEREVPSEEVPLYSLTIENGVTAKTDRYNREFLVIDKGGKKYKVVHPKDIVFNPANLRWGAIARSEVEHKVVLSPIYEVLKVDENKIDSDFLTYALTCSRQIAIFATMVEGTLVERMAVKIDTFLSCHIHVPSSKEEQKNIAHVLNLSKQEISLLKKTLEQYRSQKRGLMQKLLTGEWQVSSSQHLSEETYQEASA